MTTLYNIKNSKMKILNVFDTETFLIQIKLFSVFI